MSTEAPEGTVITVTHHSYQALLDRVTGGREEPYPVYEFGVGRKKFMSDKQGEGIYGKPTTVDGDGSIVHLPDPDLISTIAPPNSSDTIGL